MFSDSHHHECWPQITFDQSQNEYKDHILTIDLNLHTNFEFKTMNLFPYFTSQDIQYTHTNTPTHTITIV